MAGRPPKTLAAHVRENSFRARRHWSLLSGPELPWSAFAVMQARYRQANTHPARRALAVEFENAVKAAHASADAGKGASSRGGASLQEQLDALGKAGSVKQRLGFFPEFLRHAKGPVFGQPFQLERWQRAFLREFYRRDKKGRRVYQGGLLGVPRGNGKTPLAAGLGLYDLITGTDAPEVYFAAGSKEQAGIGLDFARAFVEQGQLADWITVRKALTRRKGRGVMQVISSEGTLQHGRAPSAAIIDELWAFDTARQQETYTALATALHKRPDAYLLSISTAGFDQHGLLGRIYHEALTWDDLTVSKDRCLIVAKNPEARYLVWWYGAPAGSDPENPALLRAANPASWVQVDDLQRQLRDPGVAEADFRRLHLNQWTSARDVWLTNWADLYSDEEIPDGARIHVGVDVGLYHDSTAVCWAHLTAEGRILLRAHVWAADPDAHAHTHVRGGKVQLSEIEEFIYKLSKRYRVLGVVYDPRYFDRSAELLEKRGLKLIEYLSNSAPMRDAYQHFYQLAAEGVLAHKGDPILSAQVNATAAERTETGWRIRKLKSSDRIDATVAAVLASHRAQQQKKAKSNIYWMSLDG